MFILDFKGLFSFFSMCNSKYWAAIHVFGPHLHNSFTPTGLWTIARQNTACKLYLYCHK